MAPSNGSNGIAIMTDVEALRQQLEGASCRACLFYEAVTGSGPGAEGRCRRRSPHVVEWEEKRLSGDRVPFAMWPRVYEEDWCGEFIRRSQIGEETDGEDREEASSIEGEKAS